MAKKPTIVELQDRIKRLKVYAEAYFCLRRNPPQYTVCSGERSIVVTGLERSAGGVVIAVDGEECGPIYFDAWSLEVDRSDPYLKDISGKARRLQAEAVEMRWERASWTCKQVDPP
jgi:hypothetical protein